MFKSIVEALKALWAIFNSPNNDAIIIGLLIAVSAILITHIFSFLNYKARLNDKDERIKDLIEQRNKFQAIVLASKDVERLTTNKKPKKKRKK